jgi:hypothetical protein
MILMSIHKGHRSTILMGIFCLAIQSSMPMAASAEPDGFEAGVAAFHRGDFRDSMVVIGRYTRHPEKRLSAEAYIFGMQDKKPADPWLAPSEELKAFIFKCPTSVPWSKMHLYQNTRKVAEEERFELSIHLRA